MTEKGSESRETGPGEVAAYIAGMTAEMARMARGNRLGALAYLLELAHMEAVEHTRASSEERSKRIA